MKLQIRRKIGLLLSILSIGLIASAQDSLKWIDPIKEQSILGRVDDQSLTGFTRLPDAIKNDVRDAVWSLGTNGAGLYMDFNTDAEEIVVRYTVSGGLDMPHMPKTGVSGLDLYAVDNSGDWSWTPGDYSFKDTITYKFGPIVSDAQKQYRLYLPLYNSVTWMEVGVSRGASIEFVKQEKKPIIVYGTSIAQGGCASRPGLAWTNVLGRSLNRPIINLGFSGNGRLEKPILDLIAKTEASVIVLDCLPNLTGVTAENDQRIDSLVQAAVHYLRSAQPNTPIILTDHSSGGNKKILDLKDNELYERTTKAGVASFEKLEKEGVRNLYRLSNADIALDINSTVDYAHPNDYGMMKISNAYQKLIAKILE